MTVALEVGFNELGDADEPDYRLSADMSELFSALGPPQPTPVPLPSLTPRFAVDAGRCRTYNQKVRFQKPRNRRRVQGADRKGCPDLARGPWRAA